MSERASSASACVCMAVLINRDNDKGCKLKMIELSVVGNWLAIV